jgi:hypothetical protein
MANKKEWRSFLELSGMTRGKREPEICDKTIKVSHCYNNI